MSTRHWSPLFVLALAACDEVEQPVPEALSDEYVIEGTLPEDADLDEILDEMVPGSFSVVGDPETGDVATIHLAGDPLWRNASADFTIVTPTKCINCGTGCPPTSRTLRVVLQHSAGMSGEQFTVEPVSARNFVNAVTTPGAFVTPVGNNITLDTTGDVTSCTKSFNYTFELVALPRVFVTSTSYKGNLGGIAGADQKCQDRADAVGLGGHWHAYVADSVGGLPTTRFTSVDPWVKVNSTIKVADDTADLADGSVDTLINTTELGTAVTPFNKIVWTGIRAPNTIASETCNGWTTSVSTSTGRRGSTAKSNTQWVDAGTSTCNMSNGLFCFEQ